jgi:hypothetical protein
LQLDFWKVVWKVVRERLISGSALAARLRCLLATPSVSGARRERPPPDTVKFDRTAREALPTAIETRSEFRYRNRGGSAAANPPRPTTPP